MAIFKPPSEEVEKAVFEIARIAKDGGHGRLAMPHPGTGQPVILEFDQDVALDLIAEFTDAMFADPEHDWASTPHGSREAALGAAVAEFAYVLGPPKKFKGDWTKEVARDVLPFTLLRMQLYPWFFEYLGEPTRDFFKRARELLKHLERWQVEQRS